MGAGVIRIRCARRARMNTREANHHGPARVCAPTTVASECESTVCVCCCWRQLNRSARAKASAQSFCFQNQFASSGGTTNIVQQISSSQRQRETNTRRFKFQPHRWLFLSREEETFKRQRNKTGPSEKECRDLSSVPAVLSNKLNTLIFHNKLNTYIP